MRVTFGDRKGSVTLSDDLSSYVLEAVRRVGGVVTERLEGAVAELETGARAGWPVGPRNHEHSRDKFVQELRVSRDGTVSAILKNTAPYAYMIRSAKVGEPQDPTANPHQPAKKKRLHAYSELMRKPALKIADKLVAEIGPAAVTAIGRR